MPNKVIRVAPHWYEYRVATTLGDRAAAEDSARATVALSDPVTYPRDYALDLVNLADVLVQRRKIDESAAVATEAAVTESHGGVVPRRQVGLNATARRVRR